MQDWQIAVLNSENIRVDQDQRTGYRLVIRKTDRLNRKDRLVYEVRDTDDPDVKIIVMIRMRTHYKGMLSIAFL